jgi:hypothetical protein
MLDKMVVALLLLLSIQMMVNGQTSPTGCTYVNNAGLGIGVYECDFNAITLPLAYSSFSSPKPQRLKIYNIHGHLPASSPTASFSGFSAFSGSLDPDYAASLELRCATGGTLLLYAGTFTGMSYLQRLSIYNCAIQSGFPSSGFLAIGTLDYFLVYGGSLTTLATDAFAGLYIQKLSIPDAKGELAFVDVTMPSTTLPHGLFYSLTDIVSIRLDNIGLTAITSDVFSQNTLLEKISLTYNAFTEVPSTIFDGLTKLYSVDFMGTPWNCTCDNIWLVNYVNSSGIRLETGLTCTTPTLYASKLLLNILVVQEMPTLPEHLSSPSVISGFVLLDL